MNLPSNERPLTTRSVLASALLGVRPPELPVAQLVRLAGLFGMSENRVRVALSRMVATGEVTTDGAGRYRLAGHLLDRQRRQAASLAGRRGEWKDSEWLLVVVTTSGSSADVRAARRRALALARYGELRDGVWARPDNLHEALPVALADDLLCWRGRPAADPRRLAADLFDLAGWAARAQELLEAMRRHPPERAEDLAPGFVRSAAVLRHVQADPLLPDRLLPARWPGRRLRDAYVEYDALYRALLLRWSREA